MRIIAGTHKGRCLVAPEGRLTRPTTDRVREALMSILISARASTDFSGAVVLDAFAGSGALGLEALSRGAQSVQFYERRRDAYKVLCDNISSLGYTSSVAITHFADVLSAPLASEPPFNLVFLDPPYATHAEEVFGLIARADVSHVLSRNVVISYEHDPQDEPATDAQIAQSNFSLVVRRRYAGVMVNVLRRKGECPQ